MKPIVFLAIVVGFLFLPNSLQADSPPKRKEVEAALQKAISFFQKKMARHGGHVWKSSGDGQFRMGEGIASPSMVWVQPPGTPSVGEAYLQAYRTTGSSEYLAAASEVAHSLVKGQLQSGGWYYHIEYDPKKRQKFSYRDLPKIQIKKVGKDYPGGWTIWRKRQYRGNITILDDDVTSAALRLLMQVDQAKKFQDEAIHESVEYALKSILKAQYPNGAWSHNYDRFPLINPAEWHYPVKKASFNDMWSRTWTKDWTGCYSINDNVTPNLVKTCLLAYDIYKEKRFLQAAEKGGIFFLLAQMPEPQPAWAQQYNRDMHPVWDRPFEPPAITGLESQEVLRTLLLIYRKTGNKKYLQPVPRAVKYLRKSHLPVPGPKLARFYELKTNRPLYFTRDYRLTYDDSHAPDHYGFIFDSKINDIDFEYQDLLMIPPAELSSWKEPPPRLTPELTQKVTKILKEMDSRGAWIEKDWIRNPEGRKVYPDSGVVNSQTFVDNVQTLCRYLRATKP